MYTVAWADPVYYKSEQKVDPKGGGYIFFEKDLCHSMFVFPSISLFCSLWLGLDLSHPLLSCLEHSIYTRVALCHMYLMALGILPYDD